MALVRHGAPPFANQLQLAILSCFRYPFVILYCLGIMQALKRSLSSRFFIIRSCSILVLQQKNYWNKHKSHSPFNYLLQKWTTSTILLHLKQLTTQSPNTQPSGDPLLPRSWLILAYKKVEKSLNISNSNIVMGDRPSSINLGSFSLYGDIVYQQFLPPLTRFRDCSTTACLTKC